MNNEPVAWGYLNIYKELIDVMLKPSVNRSFRDGLKEIPLYTHPVKELTDEEIKQIFQEQTGFFFDDNPADDFALMDFARAILRKAQEK